MMKINLINKCNDLEKSINQTSLLDQSFIKEDNKSCCQWFCPECCIKYIFCCFTSDEKDDQSDSQDQSYYQKNKETNKKPSDLRIIGVDDGNRLSNIQGCELTQSKENIFIISNDLITQAELLAKIEDNPNLFKSQEENNFLNRNVKYLFENYSTKIENLVSEIIDNVLNSCLQKLELNYLRADYLNERKQDVIKSFTEKMFCILDLDKKIYGSLEKKDHISKLIDKNVNDLLNSMEEFLLNPLSERISDVMKRQNEMHENDPFNEEAFDRVNYQNCAEKIIDFLESVKSKTQKYEEQSKLFEQENIIDNPRGETIVRKQQIMTREEEIKVFFQDLYKKIQGLK